MKIRITQQGDLLKITPRVPRAMFPHRYGRGDRRATTAFTQRSRKNLMEKFAIIDKERAKNATFITLTYSENYQNHKASYGHLREMLRRLLDNRDGAFACWKKELQERGAIHYHIMVWNLPYINKEELAFEWSVITNQFYVQDYGGHEGVTMPAMTRVEYCKDKRKAWYYLSKYIGKVETTTLRNDDTGELKSVFNIGTNLQKESTGRWWGWVNRQNIPLAPVVATELELTWVEYYRYRIDLRRVEGWTWVIHQSHTVKMFWFHENLDPIMMLIRGKIGEKVFGS